MSSFYINSWSYTNKNRERCIIDYITGPIDAWSSLSMGGQVNKANNLYTTEPQECIIKKQKFKTTWEGEREITDTHGLNSEG